MKIVGTHGPDVERALVAATPAFFWVDGGDGVQTPIREGEAALWDAGDEHESGPRVA